MNILNDKEKEYLNKVIEPFIDKMKFIRKEDYKNEEWLNFIYEEDGDKYNFDFPSFEKGTHYKNMEPEKEYTLKELGLEE